MLIHQTILSTCRQFEAAFVTHIIKLHESQLHVKQKHGETSVIDTAILWQGTFSIKHEDKASQNIDSMITLYLLFNIIWIVKYGTARRWSELGALCSAETRGNFAWLLVTVYSWRKRERCQSSCHSITHRRAMQINQKKRRTFQHKIVIVLLFHLLDSFHLLTFNTCQQKKAMEVTLSVQWKYTKLQHDLWFSFFDHTTWQEFLK